MSRSKTKAEISFRVIGESGPLSIFWHPGPYGDAIESKEANGVFWFSQEGQLLGVEFDDVNAEEDLVKITSPKGDLVTAQVNQGKVKVETQLKKSKKSVA